VGANKVITDTVKMIAKTHGFAVERRGISEWRLTRIALPPFRKMTVSVDENAEGTDVDISHRKIKSLGWSEALYRDLIRIEDEHQGPEKLLDDKLDAFLKEALAEAEGVALPGSEPPKPEPKKTAPASAPVRKPRKATIQVTKPKVEVRTGDRTGDRPPIIYTKDVDLVIRCMDLGPEWAQYLLDRVAPYQRKPILTQIAKWEHMMNRGDWEPMESDPICIDEDGMLANGLHRITALYFTKLTLPFYVADGVPRHRFANMDKGARRTVAHELQMMGKSSGTHLEVVTRRVHLYLDFPEQKTWTGIPTMSAKEIMEYLEVHPGIEDSVRMARIHEKKDDPRPVIASRGAVMIAHYLISRALNGNIELPQKWLHAIGQKSLPPGSPGRVLGAYWSNPRNADQYKEIGRNKIDVHTKLLINAWNATCRNEFWGEMEEPTRDFRIQMPLVPDLSAKIVP
jgi:hypothetical protein